MLHRRTDLHPGRESIENQSSHSIGKDADQVAGLGQFLIRAVDRPGELARESLRHPGQLSHIRALDNHSHGAEYLIQQGPFEEFRRVHDEGGGSSLGSA